MDESQYIEIVEHYDVEPAAIWSALTDPVQLAAWLMPNDFKLELGHRFTFTSIPIPSVGFSGTVYCQVLDFEVQRRLSISWSDGLRGGADWTVTWTIEPTPNGGTSLRLFHHGFEPGNERHQLSRRIMSSGWPSALKRIGHVVGVPGVAPGGPG